MKNNNNNLRAYRLHADIQQKQVAAKLGVSKQTVSYWQNGFRNPTTANLIALAQMYQTTVEKLIGTPDPNELHSPDEKQRASLIKEVGDKLKQLDPSQLAELKGFIAGKFGK